MAELLRMTSQVRTGASSTHALPLALLLDRFHSARELENRLDQYQVDRTPKFPLEGAVDDEMRKGGRDGVERARVEQVLLRRNEAFQSWKEEKSARSLEVLSRRGNSSQVPYALTYVASAQTAASD